MLLNNKSTRIKLLFFGVILLISNVVFHAINNNFFSSFFVQFLFVVGFGACWGMIAGLCGYYSFGHAIYAGIAAYFFTYGINFLHLPLVVIFFATLILCALSGSILVFMSTHFLVERAYFTLLTIAFLECGRIFFEVSPWFGASAGLFLENDKIPVFIKQAFVPLLSCVIFLIITLNAFLFQSKLGYYCRAIRDNKIAAQSFGIHAARGAIIIMTLSSCLTGLLGIFHVIYQKNLFPDQIFNMQRSMGFTLAPLVGGVGSVFGPIIGGLFLLPLGECIDIFIEFFKIEAAGVKQIIFGLLLLFVIFKKPDGILAEKKS
ncbi:MAG: hypothetical protein CNLJKLNK_01165 [Holosporales bacterium]